MIGVGRGRRWDDDDGAIWPAIGWMDGMEWMGASDPDAINPDRRTAHQQQQLSLTFRCAWMSASSSASTPAAAAPFLLGAIPPLMW